MTQFMISTAIFTLVILLLNCSKKTALSESKNYNKAVTVLIVILILIMAFVNGAIKGMYLIPDKTESIVYICAALLFAGISAVFHAVVKKRRSNGSAAGG